MMIIFITNYDAKISIHDEKMCSIIYIKVNFLLHVLFDNFNDCVAQLTVQQTSN